MMLVYMHLSQQQLGVLCIVVALGPSLENFEHKHTVLETADCACTHLADT